MEKEMREREDPSIPPLSVMGAYDMIGWILLLLLIVVIGLWYVVAWAWRRIYDLLDKL